MEKEKHSIVEITTPEGFETSAFELRLREGALLDFLKSSGKNVEKLADAWSEPALLHDGRMMLAHWHNMYEGPAFLVYVQDLIDRERETPIKNPNWQEKQEYLDRNAGYFIDRIEFSGSEREIEETKPLFEEFFTNPGNRYKGSYLS